MVLRFDFRHWYSTVYVFVKEVVKSRFFSAITLSNHCMCIQIYIGIMYLNATAPNLVHIWDFLNHMSTNSSLIS